MLTLESLVIVIILTVLMASCALVSFFSIPDEEPDQAKDL